VDFVKKGSSFTEFLKLKGKEKFLAAFEHNQHSYFLTALADQQVLRIYIFRPLNSRIFTPSAQLIEGR